MYCIVLRIAGTQTDQSDRCCREILNHPPIPVIPDILSALYFMLILFEVCHFISGNGTLLVYAIPRTVLPDQK
jgi:hypothetical protein